jgi:3',5'-cyclic-nucleotide phosphodiesterase
MKRLSRLVAVSITLVIFFSCAASKDKHGPVRSFVVIPLGVTGGLTEDNLPSYLLAPKGDANFVALDAGTLFAGLQKACKNNCFADISFPKDARLRCEAEIMKNHIQAYLISHSHMDHVAGLVINSPDDEPKPILGLTSTIDYLRDHLFNWKIWPNFGDEGQGFLIKKYHYVRLVPQEPQPIVNTAMTVTAFTLSHSSEISTAFLINAGANYILYLGDTGPDAVEKSTALRDLWRTIAPLLREQKLKAIIMEASYADGRPDNQLFGHLTPSWMMKELEVLAQLVDSQQPANGLLGLTVLVTHIKPLLDRGPSATDAIRSQLTQQNRWGVKFVFPRQGERIEF